MKPALAASFVLLFLLVEAQGFRLERGFIPVDHHRIQEEKESKLIEVETSGGGVAAEIVPCKDGHHCSGRSRKLLTDQEISAASTTIITTSKSAKSRMSRSEPTQKAKSSHGGLSGGKDNLSEKKLGNSEHQERAKEDYPDIMDIAGMDYSTARRKSPIHN